MSQMVRFIYKFRCMTANCDRDVETFHVKPCLSGSLVGRPRRSLSGFQTKMSLRQFSLFVAAIVHLFISIQHPV